jgi:diguanylate cyclase
MATTTAPRPITSRDQFLGRLQKALHHGNAPLALAMTDLDDFAGINRRHGHEVGDAVLAAWEGVLQSNLPTDASLLRLGGDEYVVILPGLSAENALIVLDEIRTHFSTHPLEGVPEPTSASVGVAANPPHGATSEELWRAVGEALMRAKRDGGDRMAIYVEEKMVLKSNYYSRAALDRLAKLSGATARTEASLLREALDDLFEKHRREL